MNKLILATSMILGLAFNGVALAADNPHANHIMMTGMHASSDMNKAYEVAMDKMHAPMMEGILATDPDVAFVKGMIPHHQGAIDMAVIQLKYGKNAEIRKLAEEIITAQETEIAMMQQWLKDNDKSAK